MSASNTTEYFGLPIFVGGDKPTYLGDFNGAMNAIDSALHNFSNTITEFINNTDNSTALEYAQNALSMCNTLSQNINTIQEQISVIGTDVLTTTSESLIGAINELLTSINAINTMLDKPTGSLIENKTPSKNLAIGVNDENKISFYVNDSEISNSENYEVIGNVYNSNLKLTDVSLDDCKGIIIQCGSPTIFTAPIIIMNETIKYWYQNKTSTLSYFLVSTEDAYADNTSFRFQIEYFPDDNKISITTTVKTAYGFIQVIKIK